MRNSSRARCWWFGILLIATSVATADEPNSPDQDLRASKSPSEEQIKQWVRQLGDDKVAVRDAATEALRDAGLPAVVLVRQAKYNGGLEVRNRAERILLHIEQQAIHKIDDFRGEPRGVLRKHIRSLSFGGMKNVREILPQVVAFTELEYLHLDGTDITDDDLAQIKDMTWLEELNLNKTQITDAGLVHLARLFNLKTLILANTAVEGSGVAQLGDLEKLTLLDLTRSEATNDGITNLTLLKGLKEISLKYTRVENDGLVYIAKCKSLVAVGLEGTSIDDAGIKHLLALKELKALDLGRTNVSNECIQILVAMNSLEVIALFGTKVTVDALRGLNVLPHLRVLYLPDRLERNAVEELKRQLENPDVHILMPERELEVLKSEKGLMQ